LIQVNMTTIASPTDFTPEDVLALEEEGLYELVNGRLVEKKMSSVAAETAGLIVIALGNHVLPARLGKIYPEQTFQCFNEDPEKIRRPDVAFILAQRLGGVAPEGHVRIPPDIAIEVISPSDKAYDLEEKLGDYRSAGVKLVWVVYPIARVFRIHRPDHNVTELVDGDTLTGESVLPDFSAKISNLFPVKPNA
jgi:Uma2 family endonuclease